MFRPKLLTAIAFLSIIFVGNAQDKKDAKKWDVSNPEGPYKEVAFTVNEGTWMNVCLLYTSPSPRD